MVTTQSVEALVDQAYELAPFPAIAMRVMEVAESDRFSAYDLAAVISADQALSVKLLRLANSAYYGFARRISTVRDSVVLLGFREVKSAAIAAALMEFAPPSNEEPPSFSTDLFWGHSIATAIFAEQIARQAPGVKPEEAFTAGVLHDVGVLVLYQFEPRFHEVVVQATEKNIPLSDAEHAVLGFSHVDVGGRLAERWRFPQPLIDSISQHHHPEELDQTHTLTGVVAAANHACLRLLLWCGNEPQMDEVPSTAPVLTPERIGNIITPAFQRLGGYKGLALKIDSFLTHTTGADSVRLHKVLSEAKRRSRDIDAPTSGEAVYEDA